MIKRKFIIESDGYWEAVFEPPQVILKEFLEGDLCGVDSCAKLLNFIKAPDDEAWSGEVASVIIEGEKIILESLWRDDGAEAQYNKNEFVDIVKDWKEFFSKV